MWYSVVVDPIYWIFGACPWGIISAVAASFVITFLWFSPFGFGPSSQEAIAEHKKYAEEVDPKQLRQVCTSIVVKTTRSLCKYVRMLKFDGCYLVGMLV